MTTTDIVTAPSFLVWAIRRVLSPGRATIVVLSADLLGLVIFTLRNARIKADNYMIASDKLFFTVPKGQERQARDALNRTGVENE